MGDGMTDTVNKACGNCRYAYWRADGGVCLEHEALVQIGKRAQTVPLKIYRADAKGCVRWTRLD